MDKELEGPLHKNYCMCGGACGTCEDAVGYDEEVVCPDCPLHGYSPRSKIYRQEALSGVYDRA